jgi:hypothetical protein
MPLRIDRVDTEIEILRKESDGSSTTDSGASSSSSSASGGDNLMTARGRAEFREKLRPFVMEILNDELTRIKRKIGSP